MTLSDQYSDAFGRLFSRISGSALRPYIALIEEFKILKIHKIEHRVAVMLIRSKFMVVAVYIVCLAVCDPKGYAD